jgi:hypothetical protein
MIWHKLHPQADGVGWDEAEYELRVEFRKELRRLI